VQIDLAALPDDPDVLQRMLREVVPELQAENEKLLLLVERLLRHRFGPRSEKLDLDQLRLGLEDEEQGAAEDEAARDAAEAPERPRRTQPANRNRGALPAHLPRFEVIIDVESKQCPCCGGTLHMIGEDRTEQLDIVPAQLRVKVLCRPRYGCRGCEGAVVQAPAPERPIDGGMATEALIAHVVVSKFCDSLPLYRQAQMLKRQGITLDRSTLSTWVGRACWWLKPLYELVVSTVLSTDKVFADETTLPVLEPGVIAGAWSPAGTGAFGFSELQRSALLEIANIGSGNAATALSQLLGKPVEIAYAEALLATLAEAADKIGAAASQSAVVDTPVANDGGKVLLLFPDGAGEQLCELFGTRLDDEMGRSALREVGNILASSYLNAVVEMTGMTLEPAPPTIEVDLLGSLVQRSLAGAAAGDPTVLMRSVMTVESADASFAFLFVPQLGAVELLLDHLGVGDSRAA